MGQVIFYLMIRLPPRSTRTDTLFPYTTLFRSAMPSQTGWRPCPAHRRVIGWLSGWMTTFRDLACALTTRSRVNGVRSAPVISSWKLARRSEEHTSELQSLMRLSYAVFCLKKKTIQSTIYLIFHMYHIYTT